MIDFYYGSGSPFGWRVWLTLEHLGARYTLHTLSFSSGELKGPAYRAINPRGRVPAIVDDGFALWESAAIVEYLNDKLGQPTTRLIPSELREAAVVRRMVAEIDNDYVPANEELVSEILYADATSRDASRIERARGKLLRELSLWNERLASGGPWLGGAALSAADFALYPLVALTLRMEQRHLALDVAAHRGSALVEWMNRVGSLPVHERTYPPHWR